MRMTLDEIMSTCKDWDEFCDWKGFEPYTINEGGGHIEVDLTLEEAYKLGIIKRIKW